MEMEDTDLRTKRGVERPDAAVWESGPISDGRGSLDGDADTAGQHQIRPVMETRWHLAGVDSGCPGGLPGTAGRGRSNRSFDAKSDPYCRIHLPHCGQ